MKVTQRVEFKSQNVILKSWAHLRTELQCGRGPTSTDHHQAGWGCGVHDAVHSLVLMKVLIAFLSACGILQFITAAGGSPELN